MIPKSKILDSSHTGRLRPHEHTSYFTLAFLVLVLGLVLIAFSFSYTSAESPGPQGGSVGLTGTMPAAPPKTAAYISLPSNNSRTRISPIEVSGSCPSETLIEIYKNNIFAGSASCENSKFSVKIDLFYGKNVLKAQVYDALNQAGPASNSVTVYYDSTLQATSDIIALGLDGPQLLLSTDAVFRGSFPGQALNVPITIIGGSPPYAINVEWGDNDNKVMPRLNNLTFNAQHTYQKAGNYGLTLQATDSKQRTAFLTVTAIINGQPASIAATKSSGGGKVNKLLVIWPLYAIAATMVVSFWAGEIREKKILKRGLQDQKPLLGTAHTGQ